MLSVSNGISGDSNNTDFSYIYSNLQWKGVRKINPTITDWGTTYLLWIEIADGEVAWSNFDILYQNGNVAFAGSRPVDPVTGKEITLYDLPSDEVITRKFHIPSYLEGIKVGQFECSKRNPIPVFDSSDDFLHHEGIIPEGGTYYIGVTGATAGDYSTATTTISAGESFPETMNDGDVYVFGDYEYRYNRYPSKGLLGTSKRRWYSSSGNEWGVALVDYSKESYDEAISVINGKRVTKTQALYYKCTAITKAPKLPKYASSFNYIFGDCTLLEDISELIIPKSITSLDYAFQNCVALKDAPDFSRLFKVTSMKYTFSGCTALEEASTIPPRVKSLVRTFSGCTSLTKVSNIPSNVEDMNYTFSGCTLLTEVPKLPSSVTSMTGTFYGCTGLVSNIAVLNATKVTSMYNTFNGCTSLKEAYLPPNLIGGYEIFTGCTALESTPDYSYMKDCVMLEYVFQECTALTTVEGLPPNIKYLDSTFYKCSALENIPAIPYGVKSLYNCFSDTGIKEFPSIPSTVENISQLCRNCVNLTSVSPVIPSSVTNITYLFSGCSGLKEVNGLSIPSKVTSISGLFNECTALEKVLNFIIHPNVTVFTYVFDGCIALTDISGFAFSAKAKDLGGCFQGCTSLGDVTGLVIPSEVNDMWYVFKSCTNLTGTIQVNVKSENIIYNTNEGNNSCYQCFMDTTKPITLKGTGDNTTVLNLLKGTATNSNVTVS